MNLKSLGFAAFVISHKRNETLSQTINRIFCQSVVPGRIVIIDNNPESLKFDDFQFDQSERIIFHHMGRNSGPAGGAEVGLTLLATEGFQWIYWGDDDDPPEFGDEFGELLKLAADPANKDVGILGVVGHRFNRYSGEIFRTSDAELEANPVVEVDSVAGNQCMLVNAEVVRKGILPDPKLFFGFEELDFCLRVRDAGYRILVPSHLFLRARARHGRSGLRRPAYARKDLSRIHRQYYSTRNILIILRKNRLGLAFIYQSSKALAKMIYGFRYGWRYGLSNLSMVGAGLWDGIRNLPGKKY